MIGLATFFQALPSINHSACSSQTSSTRPYRQTSHAICKSWRCPLSDIAAQYPVAQSIPCSLQSSDTGTPLSACFKIPLSWIAVQSTAGQCIICASLYRAFFIKISSDYYAEKVLLVNSTNFMEDYRTTSYPRGRHKSFLACGAGI